ncbi:VOC family protein [Maribacter arenosus]|uniref:VOC family protein n=1 Tax=Maribacter arenosus TaxID=1854708 RepID=A0ABR7VAQ9_9FLAO|nr:VOC family protein [Maribacter arenosus]MBD0849945.1 VOC family protein [Maribacter arenosus]
MKEKRVTHFEIPCENPEKTMKFFEQVFSWKFQKFGNEDYWFAITGNEDPGINGAIMKKRKPDQPITNSISVENMDEALKNIEKHKGQIVVPKMAIPTSGWLAFFKDPDGNIHGVWQDDQKAK